MKVTYVEFLGQKHPLCFSLAASEKILEEFGSLESMSQAITGEDVPRKVHALDRVLQILMKAGRIYVSACGEDLPPELPCRPADLIDVRDPQAVAAIFAVMRSDTERTVEAEAKNGEPTPDP